MRVRRSRPRNNISPRFARCGALPVPFNRTLSEATPDKSSPMIDARLIDLSHTIEHGMITYKGLPAPIICDYLSREESRKRYAPGTEFHIGKIEMVANTGTYLDSPFHRYADGKDLSQLDLASVADLEGVVVRARTRSNRAIGREAFEDVHVRGRAVLIDT